MTDHDAEAVNGRADRAPLDLSGRWRAGVADEELRRIWYGDDFDDENFDDVDVPGHWRSHPDFAANDEPLLYRRHFSALRPEPGTRAWLHFAGVCAQGDVWLDGQYLGDTDGAWVPGHFEVTDALTGRTDHTLGVEVASPPAPGEGPKRGLLGTWQTGPYVGPGWNPGGIWKPVTLHRTGPVAIVAHRVLCTAATPTRATVTFVCTLDSADARSVTIRTTVAGRDHEQDHNLASGENTVTWSVEVPDPALWWPHELGDQPLVDVGVELFAVSDGSAIPSDGFATRCGLRQASLREWVLSINGERLFTKGVLVGPAARDLGTAPADRFARVIDTAREVGANLVRVHGHLSRDELYDAADAAGMLVWQDLPLYRAQHRSVRRLAGRTARHAVDALGAHPSIVIWCAHDEPDEPEEPTVHGPGSAGASPPRSCRAGTDRCSTDR